MFFQRHDVVWHSQPPQQSHMAYYSSITSVPIATFFSIVFEGSELPSDPESHYRAPPCKAQSTSEMVRFCSILQKEKRLEKKGEIYALQAFRSKMSGRHEIAYSRKEHVAEFLQSERRLREIAQREISLAAGIERKSPEEQAKINDKLDTLRADYFLEDLRRERLRSYFIDESLNRAFDLWRSHPYWYLHKTLIDDCATRGGCCGRACGCCRNRKLPPQRRSAVGHCTLECLCCQVSRDFESHRLGDTAKKWVNEMFPLDPQKNYKYYLKIMMASIYGIKLGSTHNPFDLIDIPPEYEESESSERTSLTGLTLLRFWPFQ